MSYLVLARKYRPRNFSEMVGQDHVVQALSNALTTQRLHHAYLFTGTRGVGKTTVSRILAKSLNCQGVDGQGGITATPCGVCQACTDIDVGRFVDYTELDAASNRGVDEVQSLLEQAVYKPVQGRFKVFMIDEVHMLTNTAFNAMLKTLEEPPQYLKFVLATTDPQKVPVTVLSRCLQFNLRPMAPETVREHLQQVLEQESVQADTQALRLLARAARGSMRDALSLTDQAIAFGAGQLQEATVRQMLGSVDRGYVFRLIEALAGGDGSAVVQTSETLRLNGLSAASTLEEMATVLQRMAVLQATAATEVDDSDPEAADLARLSALLPADETQLLYSICLHGRADLGLAPDEYAALTMVLLRLLAFKPKAEKKTLAKTDSSRPESALPRSGPATEAAPASAVPASAPARSTPVTAAAKVQPWEDQPATRVPAMASASAGAATAGTAPTSAPSVATPSALPVPPPPRTPVPAPQTVAPHNGMPAGLRLPVHDPEPVASSGAGLQDEAEQSGTASIQTAAPLPKPPSKVLAVPVVVQHSEAQADISHNPAAPTLIATEEGAFWHETVQQLIAAQSITAMVRELAMQSQLIARDTDQWQLRVENETLNQPASRERLGNALLQLGHEVKLVVEIGRVTDCPARRNTAASDEKLRAAERIILADPFVQSMVRDFGAKIVPGSIKPL